MRHTNPINIIWGNRLRILYLYRTSRVKFFFFVNSWGSLLVLLLPIHKRKDMSVPSILIVIQNGRCKGYTHIGFMLIISSVPSNLHRNPLWSQGTINPCRFIVHNHYRWTVGRWPVVHSGYYYVVVSQSLFHHIK